MACARAQISDVAPASSCTFFDRAGTHDRAWVWKPLNKARACSRDHAVRVPSSHPCLSSASQVMRGQTLITRTINAATFHATYVQEEIRPANV